MNILYIIGNGFDKAQGLDTCYTDFYQDYMKINPGSELEERVKSYIRGDYTTWENMELAMGVYSSEFEDVDVFRNVIKLLNERLKEYLIKQSSRIDDLNLNQQKLIRDLLNPAYRLEESSKRLFYQINSGSHSKTIRWVTFNYTDTFERVLGFNKGSLQKHYQGEDKLDSVLHIHGLLTEKIVLGVNNVEQISNVDFRSNKFLQLEFVKPNYNAGCLNDRDVVFSQFIHDANVIVLMGTSVGTTDSIWWEQVGRWIDNNPQTALLYFPFDPQKNTVENECYKGLWSEEYVAFLKERMSIRMSMDKLTSRILVGINKDILKLV